jgi:ferredoxin/flavodoxin---NADP+ reductase
MIGDENGKLKQVEIEDNFLVDVNGDTKAKGTGNKRCLDVETVIFAIGDKVDNDFGLPVEWNEFVKSPNPRFPIDGISYESPFEDVFVGGWSRQASTGLVGYARKDGTNASKAVSAYLQTKEPVGPNLKGLAEKIKSLNKFLVTKEDVKKLEAIEIAEAQKRGVEEFKFDTNDDMLQAIGLTVAA